MNSKAIRATNGSFGAGVFRVGITNVKQVNEPLATRKTEYYALRHNGPDENPVYGPFNSIREVEGILDIGEPGEYTIVTKVKKVVVG